MARHLIIIFLIVALYDKGTPRKTEEFIWITLLIEIKILLSNLGIGFNQNQK